MIRRNILVLSDGKPGHYNQSLGIVDKMTDLSISVIDIRFKSKWRDNLLRVSVRLLYNFRILKSLIIRMLRWAIEKPSVEKLLEEKDVDIILSTGSSVAAPNFLLGRLTRAKSVVCTRPSPIGAKPFDMAILPEHSRPRRIAQNIVMTFGVPNRITREKVDEAGSLLAEKLYISKNHVIGVLLGGDDPYYSVSPTMTSLLCDALIDICNEIGACIALTTSRRTVAASEDIIRSKLSDSPLCCLLIFASEPQQSSPVSGIIGISDVVIVTEDSFSMVCEAASSGKKVIILDVERKRDNPKRQRVYQLMTENGYTRRSNIANLRHDIADFINDSSYIRYLDDAQLAANALWDLLP